MLAQAGAGVAVGYRSRRAEADETLAEVRRLRRPAIGVAVELAPRRINVNCVAPGWVDTEMSATPYAREAGKGKQEIVRTIPLGRLASPEDCAGPIVFLCSDLAGHITGEILNVNGGSVLCG